MSTALREAATGQAAKTKTIFELLENPRFKAGLAAVAGKFFTPERVLRLCVNAIKKTPDLQKCNPQSVLGAMMTTAALGLEPNTPQQLAFLIPYRQWTKRGEQWVQIYDCQFQIGARGFVTLAYRSPLIESLHAEAIHAGDHFKHMKGSKAFLEFEKNLKDRGTLIGSYSWCSLKSGREEACVLPLDEIMKIREKSETFRALRTKLEQAQASNDAKSLADAQRKFDETPWRMWEDDMAAKSAIKKHAKQLPIAASDSLATAAEIDSNAEAGILDLESLADPDVVRDVVAGDAEAPRLEHLPADTTVSDIAFGATARAAEAEKVEASSSSEPAAEPAKKEPKAKPTEEKVERAKPKKKTYAEYAELVKAAIDRDVAAEIVDLARSDLPADLHADLGELFKRTFAKAK